MDQGPYVDESLIAMVWERQAFETAALARLGLRVVFRGMPSDAGGPDYQDAMFAFGERTLLRGDVEFHVHSSDWYRHGHDRNERYNSVLLHVVWSADTNDTRRRDGVAIPTLALEGDARARRLAPVTRTGALIPHPCVATFAGLSPDAFADDVRALGIDRFRQRAAQFAADMTAEAPDQVIYRALLEGMGYASNRTLFRLLADAVPHAWLLQVPPQERCAVLLAAAGLGPEGEYPPPAHLPAEDWRLSRLRPANHPALRLRGVAILLERLAPSLADSLHRVILAAGRPAKLRAALTAGSEDETYIGAGRADELAVSVVLPFVAALEPPSGPAEQLYLRYPSPPFNRWTRFMLGLAHQAGHDALRVRLAPEHQGLHGLYHAFCRRGPAPGCPLCRGIAVEPAVRPERPAKPT